MLPFIRLRSVATLAFVVPVFAACSSADTKHASDPSAESGKARSGPAEIGHLAPDLSMKSVNGKGRVGIAGMTGKVVLVDFWATWCGPCRKSFPALQQISKRHAGQVEVVGVSVNDDADGVADFAKELGTTFAIGWDEGHSIAERWAVTSMPSSFIVDGSGTVRYVHNGYHEGDEIEIEKEVLSLLGKGPAPDKAKPSPEKTATVEKPEAPAATPPPSAAAPPPPPVKKAIKKKKKKK